MNGNVVGWMAISGSVFGAGGVLVGRFLERGPAFREGVDRGLKIAEIEAQEQASNAALEKAKIERWQALMEGLPPPEPPVGRHGHPGPCSHERGCW